MPPLNTLSKTTLAIALSQALSAPIQAATLTVDSLLDNTIANDSSCTLREAVNSLNTGVLNSDCSTQAPGPDDEILFDPSITTTDTISLTEGRLVFRNNVRVTAPTKTASPPFSFDRLTILQTTAGDRVLEAFNGQSTAGPVVTLRNLAIQGGQTSGYGSGILANFGAVLTIDDSVISSNTSTGRGGGLVVSNNSDITLNDSTVSQNSSNTRGGGLDISNSSTATINYSLILANYASTDGAGISVVNSSTLTINNSSLEFNSASRRGGCIVSLSNSTVSINEGYFNRCYASTDGGGISSIDSTIDVGNTNFFDNQTRGTAFNNGGGAIDVRGTSRVAISDTRLVSNYSANDGGAINSFSTGVVEINRSSISGNSAIRFGGGIYSTGPIDVVSSSVFSNRADRGGGLLANNGGVIGLSNSTLLGNYASNRGGGLVSSVNSEVNISNSLVILNRSGNAANELIEENGDVNLIGVNVLGHGGDTSVEAFTANFTPDVPHIVATSDGNMPTPAAEIIDSSLFTAPNQTGFAALAPDSPGIGVAITDECPVQDQRGITREDALIVPIKASNNKLAVIDLGGECDVGAVEFDQSLITR